MEAFIVWPPSKCEDASGHVHQSGIFRNPRRWNSALFCWRDQDPGCSGGVGLFETTSFMWSTAEEEQTPGQPSSHVLLVKSYSKGAWLTDVTANFNNCAMRAPLQRPKKSELSGWQLSTRKNFPDEVRKSFLRQKKRVNRFCDKKKYA